MADHRGVRTARLGLGYPPQVVFLSGYLLSIILGVILGRITLGKKRGEDRSFFREEQQQTILEHANDGILITRQGVVCYANSKIAEIVGYSADRMIGMHADQFIAPDQLAQMRDLCRRRALGEAVSARFALAIWHVAGKWIGVDVNTADIHFHGEPASVAIVRAMTEHKQLEKHMN